MLPDDTVSVQCPSDAVRDCEEGKGCSPLAELNSRSHHFGLAAGMPDDRIGGYIDK
jgi:hypothetical protein